MSGAKQRMLALRADLRQRFPALHGVVQRSAEKPPAIRSDPTAIILGRDQKRLPLGLPLRARLEHCFVLGATGSGKSRLLLHYIKQTIKNGEGALILDPHGDHPDSPFQALVSWLPEQGRRVHIIDLNATSHAVGFNPLACPADTDISVIAGKNIDAIAVSWEGESFAQKPTIERNLTVAFSALSELGLTFVEAPMLFDHKDEHGLRAWAIQHVQDRYTRDELKRLHELSQDGRRRRDFDQETVGPLNRLQRLLRPQALRVMLGQTDRVLDIKAAMDNGEVILANLSGGSRVYERDADLFGRLLVRDALFHAKRRDNGRPFTVMLDEAHRFLSGDIPTLLAEVRKNGVSIVAAMQWLEQASTDDDKILTALMNGTNAKICFRVRDAEEAERMAHSNIPVDVETPVTVLTKPTVTGHRRIRLNNESRTDQQTVTESLALTEGVTIGRSVTVGETVSSGVARSSGEAQMESSSRMHSQSHGESAGIGDGASAGEVMIPTGDYWHPQSTSAETAGTNSVMTSAHSSAFADARGLSSGTAKNHSITYSKSTASTYAESSSRSEMAAQTRGQARSVGTGTSEGSSEALEPILEWLPSAVHSKDTMLYKAGQMLRSLPTGIAYLNYVGQSGAVSTLFTVPPIFTPSIARDEFSRMRDALIATSPAAIPIKAALWHIADRERELRSRTSPPATKPRTKKARVIDTPDEKGTWG